MRMLLLLLLVGLGGLGGALPAAAARPFALTDERGVVVTLDQAPKRIVSMLPSLTESVCELGECARLVGVDRFSNWPALVVGLPHLGGLDDADVEGIVGLRPDVVLLSKSARITERLSALGIKVVVLEPKSHEDVKRVLEVLGGLLQIPQATGAGRLWRVIDEGIAAAAVTVPTSVRGARVYFEVNRAPYAAGASSFIGETLSRLGVVNIVPPELGPFPKLNPEYVVRANPDVIMIGDRSFETLMQRPGWPAIRAVREDRVCRFPPEQGDVLVRPGPRMAEAARIMAACLREKAW